MPKQIIRTSDAPNSRLFSQAVKVGPTIYVSGMVGVDPTTNQLAGASLEDVVDVLVLLAQPGDFAGLNEAYGKFFPTDPPARAVGKLGVELPNVLVSIKLTASV